MGVPDPRGFDPDPAPLRGLIRLLRRLADARSWRLLTGASVALVLGVGTVLREIDAVLAEMHLPGGLSSTLEGALWGSPAHVRAALTAWREFVAADVADTYADPATIGLSALALDAVLFVPALAYLLIVLLLRTSIRERLPEAVAFALRGRAARREAQVRVRGGTDEEAARARDQVTADLELASLGFHRVLGATAAGVVAWVLTDWLENVLRAFVLVRYLEPGADPGGAWPVVVGVLRLVTAAKWTLLAGIAVVVAVLGLLFLTRETVRIGLLLRLARGQVIVTVVLVAAMLARLQVPDVMLRLSARQLVLVVLLTLALGLVNWAFARHLLLRGTSPAAWHEGPVQPVGRLLLPVLAGLLAVAVVVVVAGGGWFGAAVPVGMAALVTVLGLPLRGWSDGGKAPRPEPVSQGDVFAAMLGAAAPVALGLSLLRATVGTAFAFRASGYDAHLRGLIAAGGVLVVSGAVMFGALRRFDRSCVMHDEQARHHVRWTRGRHLRIVQLALVPTVACYVLVLATPYDAAVALSAVGVLMAFLLAASIAAGWLVLLAEWASSRFALPRAFRLVRLHRLPVFTLLVVWATLSAALDSGRHFDVRRIDGTVPPAQAAVTVVGAWESWRDANVSGVTAAPPGGRRTAVPLVIVAASGGGIRAAYWTAKAMTCLFQGRPAAPCGGPQSGAGAPADRSGRVFVASGISGGSLGLAEYAAHLATGGTDPGWVDARLSDDYLSPQLAWMLFAELPRSFLEFRVPDRAEIGERGWSRSWDEGGGGPLERGLLELQATTGRDRIPLLLLNGTSVRDGCWVATTVLHDTDARTRDPGDCLRAEAPHTLPAVADVLEFLCDGDDLALSTAAMLSARFPGISPAGRLQPCDAEEATKYVVDGGYVEASGAENGLAVWERVEPLVDEFNATSDTACVVPFFVQLDNGYVDRTADTAPRPPNQLLAPVEAANAAGRGARSERARGVARQEFTARNRQLGVRLGGAPLGGRFEQLVPIGHPGAEAPLGWSLSRLARDDLTEQLLRTGPNLAAIGRIREWLTGDLSCDARPG